MKLKLFVINTRSESGDNYSYVVKHPDRPTEDELKAFLIKHSCDKSDFTLYEYVQEVVEVVEEDADTIPKLSKKTLDKWDGC